MTEYTRDYEQEELALAERSRLLEEFAERPTDDAIWQSAYGLVRQEGDGVPPGCEATPAATAGAQELIDLAERVRATPQEGRYRLMTEPALDGRPWFDVLQTFSLEQPEQAKAAALRYIADQRGGRFDSALDLGTGTGKSLASLEAVADRVVGIDRNPDLLALADTNKAADTELVLASVTDLPFADASFDVASSRGLEGALDEVSMAKMLSEVSRVLRPGGMYVTSSVRTADDGYRGYEMEDIRRTAKSVLADMIVDTTSGGLEIQAAWSATYEEYMAMLQAAGLQPSVLEVHDDQDGVYCAVSVLEKVT